MNLWVKRTGQLFIAVLFLMSCEDDSFLLGFKGKEKFQGKYQELSLGSSVMLVDSVITDNVGGTIRLLTGRYLDDVFGEVRSESYTEFYPSTKVQIDATSVLDSVTIQFRLDTYVYGSAGTSNEQFYIHELTEQLSDSILEQGTGFRYYFNSGITYNPTPIASATMEVSYDSLKKNSSLSEASQDTIQLTFKLENTSGFSVRLFDFAKNRVVTDSALVPQFRSEFYGLAIVPDPLNTKIIGFNPRSVLSRITIHYHTDTEDSLTRTHFLGNISFNQVVTDRSSSELAGLSAYQEFEVSNGYIQSGSPVITQLDLTEFYNFVQDIPEMTINSAELSFTPTGIVDGLEPPTQLSVRLQNENNNQFLNLLVNDDREFLTGYEQLFSEGRYYTAGGDFNLSPSTSTALLPPSQGQSVVLSYLESENRYTGFMTLFMQNLFENKTKEDKIFYVSLNPLSPAVGKTVNRVVFDKSSVKLKIYYTIPVSDNL